MFHGGAPPLPRCQTDLFTWALLSVDVFWGRGALAASINRTRDEGVASPMLSLRNPTAPTRTVFFKSEAEQAGRVPGQQSFLLGRIQP